MSEYIMWNSITCLSNECRKTWFAYVCICLLFVPSFFRLFVTCVYLPSNSLESPFAAYLSRSQLYISCMHSGRTVRTSRQVRGSVSDRLISDNALNWNLLTNAWTGETGSRFGFEQAGPSGRYVYDLCVIWKVLDLHNSAVAKPWRHGWDMLAKHLQRDHHTFSQF